MNMKFSIRERQWHGLRIIITILGRNSNGIKIKLQSLVIRDTRKYSKNLDEKK